MFISPINIAFRNKNRDELRQDSYYRRVGSHNMIYRSARRNYFLNKLAEIDKDFEPICINNTLRGKINNLLNEHFVPIKSKVMSIITDETLASSFLPNYNRRALDSVFSPTVDAYFAYDKGVVAKSQEEDRAFIISKSKEDAMFISDKLSSKIKEISVVSGDFGVEATAVNTGKEYASDIITHLENIKGGSDGQAKNDFESKIIEEVSDFTNSLLPNYIVDFENPTEQFEYDLLIPLTSSSIIDIEVKDYDNVKSEIGITSEKLKNKIILEPLDKVKRINATPIIIVNKFPQDVLKQMQILASSRGVTLIEYTETSEKQIEQKIFKTLIDLLTEEKNEEFGI